MTKHTPGPWHAEYFPNAFGWDVTHGPSDDGSQRFSVIDDTKEQDARLIAAAPDMLDALKAALECIDNYVGDGPTYQIVKSAIAKAEGCDESTAQSGDIRFENVVGLIVMAGNTASTYGPQQISIPEQSITVRRSAK